MNERPLTIHGEGAFRRIRGRQTREPPTKPAVSVADATIGTMTPSRLLAFERTHPHHDGTKEETIRSELGVTPARYYVLLGRAARSMEGIASDAITARRIRERRRATTGIGGGHQSGDTCRFSGAILGES